MWWKVYFWTILVLAIMGTLFGYGTKTMWTLGDWLDIGVSVLSLCGLYSFVYKKKMFEQKVWLYIFWVSTVMLAFYLVYFFTPLHQTLMIPEFIKSSSYTSGQLVLVDLIISAPTIYALYFLAYPQAKKRKR